MDTETDRSPLQLRTFYERPYSELLYTLLYRCLNSYGDNDSGFHREVLGVVERAAERFVDETGKSLSGILKHEQTEANLRAFRRYLKSKGRSVPLPINRMVDAYLQIQELEMLTDYHALRASNAVGKALGGFLRDPSRPICAVTSDVSRKYVIESAYNTDEGTNYLVFLPGATSDYTICLNFNSLDETDNDDDSDHLRLKFGFSVQLAVQAIICMRDFCGAGRYYGWVRKFEEYGRMVVSLYSRPKGPNMMGRKINDPSIINKLQKKVDKFRMELL